MSEIFKRKEKKYLISEEQKENLLKDISDFIEKDKFFNTSVRSLYFDTDDFRMITRSIEKPLYKEKLRARYYDNPMADDLVFFELKKKLDGIVYKRRTRVRYLDMLNNASLCHFEDEQIGNEIKQALDYYFDLKPKVFIGYDRTSYKGKQESDLRLTFDENSKFRFNRLSLDFDEDDKLITDKVVLEIKANQAYPLWLAHALDKNKIYPHSFSKVGTAYLKHIGGK